MSTIFDNTPREKSILRWPLLALCCLATFGLFYCFDTVGAVHEHLKSQFDFLGENFEYYYQLLYSVYGLINIIFPLIGGIVINKFGPRLTFVIFGTIFLIGQLIVCIGCQYYSIYIMIIGRIIFGIGGETLTVCQNAMIAKWFFKSELSFPMAMTITVSRAGNFLNDILSPHFAGDINKDGKYNALNAFKWGCIFAFFSYLTIIAMYLIDYYKDKAINNNLDLSVDNINNDSSFCQLLKQINIMAWIICFIIVSCYGSLNPFNFMSVGFYTQKGIDKNIAGIYMGIPYMIGGVISPPLGLLIDKFGHRLIYLYVGVIFYITAYMLFNYIHPLIPIFILGLGYSGFAAVLWPTVSIVLENKNISGFVYGIVASVFNIAITVNPMIVAWLLVNFKKYNYCLYFFVSLSAVCGIFCILLFFENRYHRNNILNKTKYEDEEGPSIELQKNLDYDNKQNSFEPFKDEI